LDWEAGPSSQHGGASGDMISRPGTRLGLAKSENNTSIISKAHKKNLWNLAFLKLLPTLNWNVGLVAELVNFYRKLEKYRGVILFDKPVGNGEFQIVIVGTMLAIEERMDE